MFGCLSGCALRVYLGWLSYLINKIGNVTKKCIHVIVVFGDFRVP